MGQFRERLGLKPELYNPARAVSHGNRRVDVLLDDEGEKPAPAKPSEPEKPKTLATDRKPT